MGIWLCWEPAHISTRIHLNAYADDKIPRPVFSPIPFEDKQRRMPVMLLRAFFLLCVFPNRTNSGICFDAQPSVDQLCLWRGYAKKKRITIRRKQKLERSVIHMLLSNESNTHWDEKWLCLLCVSVYFGSGARSRRRHTAANPSYSPRFTYRHMLYMLYVTCLLPACTTCVWIVYGSADLTFFSSL